MEFSGSNIMISLKRIFSKFFGAILIFVVLILLSIGYHFILSPRIHDIKSGGESSLESNKNRIAELKNYIDGLEYMSSNYKSITKEKIDSLSQILPREKDFPGLFVQMDEIAKKNDFILNSVGISSISESQVAQNIPEENLGDGGGADPAAEQLPIINASGIKELNVTFIITGGDYEDLKSFLSDIEQNIRLFDIYDINFSNVKSGPYSINLRTYYLSE